MGRKKTKKVGKKLKLIHKPYAIKGYVYINGYVYISEYM
jgi:hypothetical protein